MHACPFCKGPAVGTHTPQECLAHMRARLREMTERRDALQVSLDNERRKNEKLKARRAAAERALHDTIRDYREVLDRERKTTQRAIRGLKAIKRAVDGALTIPETPFSKCRNPECPVGCPDSHALVAVSLDGAEFQEAAHG